tara:strand:+ start:22227 stop:23570 length:1344 start_codon:yes stop_codon:yes gene_type:complete
MKKVIVLFLISVNSFSQIPIPDINFENKLIELGYDNLIDGQIGYNYTVYALDLSGALIQDLTGIEAFPNLCELDVSYNLLTEIDLSNLYASYTVNGSANWNCSAVNESIAINFEFNPQLNYINLSNYVPYYINFSLSLTGTDVNCIESNYAFSWAKSSPAWGSFFANECGCTNPDAINFNLSADGDDGTCIISGCTDELACNYNELANEDFEGQLCDYAQELYDCEGNCIEDIDSDGICDELEVLGCTNSDADNFNPLATEDDSSCYFTIYGCTDEFACNYNELANEDFEGQLCDYAEEFYDCEGNCIEDVDEDGICDELEIEGCSQDFTACNYNPLGTQFCVYPEDIYGVNYLDCDGNCVLDTDIDNICDEIDNCPDVYNPNQDDYDLDGIGDSCDGLSLYENLEKRKLIYIKDILGRDATNYESNKIRLYLYSDGRVEKKITQFK